MKPGRSSREEQGRKDSEGRGALVGGKNKAVEAEVSEETGGGGKGEANSVCHTPYIARARTGQTTSILTITRIFSQQYSATRNVDVIWGLVYKRLHLVTWRKQALNVKSLSHVFTKHCYKNVASARCLVSAKYSSAEPA